MFYEYFVVYSDIKREVFYAVGFLYVVLAIASYRSSLFVGWAYT